MQYISNFDTFFFVWIKFWCTWDCVPQTFSHRSSRVYRARVNNSNSDNYVQIRIGQPRKLAARAHVTVFHQH